MFPCTVRPSSRTASERSGFRLTMGVNPVEADADPTPETPRIPSTSARLVPNAMSILRRRCGANCDSPIPVSCAANFRLCARTGDSIARRGRSRVTIIPSPEKGYQSVISAESLAYLARSAKTGARDFSKTPAAVALWFSCEWFGQALAQLRADLAAGELETSFLPGRSFSGPADFNTQL